MKIQLKDLRLGNYILINIFSSDPDEPKQLTLQDMITIQKYRAPIEGVPITEEWLLRFGFEHLYGDHYENGLVEIYFSSKGVELLVEKRTPFNYYYKDVHQLQNLYHALTGQELTIKPTEG